MRRVGARALEAARRARAGRHEREADAADLPALGPDRRGPRVGRAGAARERSSEFETSSRSACTLPTTVQASSVRWPPAGEAVAGLALGGARDRQQPAAAAPARAAEGDLVARADASITESFAVTSAPSTATTGPTTQWSSVTGANGCRTIRLARAERRRLAVGVARHARDERAVAQDERARPRVRRPPRSRAARRRARGRPGRRVVSGSMRELAAGRRASSGRARFAERSTRAVGACGAGVVAVIVAGAA